MALLTHSPELFAAKVFINPNPIPKVIKGLKSEVAFRPMVRAEAGAGCKSGDRGGNVRVSDFDKNLLLYGQFSAAVKEETARSKEEEEKQNYYVNMGYAIRTLREEFADIFYREPSFDIYRDDIVFKDPLNTFVGIENYKSIFWALRFHGRIFFRALWIDIISVWQPVENVIMVRWTVHGIPRVPWESRGRFDGTSEYKLDKHGKIFHHRVDNVSLSSPPKFGVLAVEELIQSIGCSSTPKPTYFEASSGCLKKE